MVRGFMQKMGTQAKIAYLREKEETIGLTTEEEALLGALLDLEETRDRMAKAKQTKVGVLK